MFIFVFREEDGAFCFLFLDFYMLWCLGASKSSAGHTEPDLADWMTVVRYHRLQLSPDVPWSPRQQFSCLSAFPLAHFYHMTNGYIRERRCPLMWTLQPRRQTAELAMRQNKT